MMSVPDWPARNTLEIARLIRRTFGYGGCTFPGADELYEAARKIEAWAAEWEWPEDAAP